MSRHRGIGPGFDFLRIALAVLIFVSHTGLITAGYAGHHAAADLQTAAKAVQTLNTPIMEETGWDGWGRPFRVALVPMFFALSGFLVTGSAFRLRNVKTFIGFRVLRILPALLTEVALSALVLGSAFTQLPLGEYFSNPGFYAYFGNIVGWIHLFLPGVFFQNPVQIVNGNLWTLPAEFDCYLITAVMMILGIMFRPRPFTIIILVGALAGIGLNIFTEFGASHFHVDEVTLVFYFFIGSAFYQWRDRISINPVFFIISVVASFVLLESRHGIYPASFFLVYCTAWLGMLPIPKLPLASKGDYSYGVYLYGYPICQGLIAAFPIFIGHRWSALVVGGLLTCLFAAFSWHFIEKPSLRLKNLLSTRLIRTSTEPALNGGTALKGEATRS